MYEIQPYTRERARLVGVTVEPSSVRGKKIDVYADGLKIASIGAQGYKDYPTFLATEGPAAAEEHRRRYRMRHTKKTLGEMLALWLLW